MSAAVQIDNLTTAGVATLGCLMRSGATSPLEVLDAFLDRIGRHDGQVRSFLTLDTERARAAAVTVGEELRAGRDRGPFHGIPFALKDNIDTAGLRTTSHSRQDLDRVPRPRRDPGHLSARTRAASCSAKPPPSNTPSAARPGTCHSPLPQPMERRPPPGRILQRLRCRRRCPLRARRRRHGHRRLGTLARRDPAGSPGMKPPMAWSAAPASCRTPTRWTIAAR